MKNETSLNIKTQRKAKIKQKTAHKKLSWSKRDLGQIGKKLI